MDAKKFTNYLKFAAHAVDWSSVRYYLQGVLFEFRAPDVLTLVGTDGHRMAMARIAGPHMMPDCEIIVSNYAAVLSAFAKATGEVTAFDGGLMNEQGTVVRLAAIDGKFPDWRRVMPNGIGPAPTVNPKYLAEATAALKFATTGVTVTPVPCGLELTAEGGALKAVVMGLRV